MERRKITIPLVLIVLIAVFGAAVRITRNSQRLSELRKAVLEKRRNTAINLNSDTEADALLKALQEQLDAANRKLKELQARSNTMPSVLKPTLDTKVDTPQVQELLQQSVSSFVERKYRSLLDRQNDKKRRDQLARLLYLKNFKGGVELEMPLFGTKATIVNPVGLADSIEGEIKTLLNPAEYVAYQEIEAASPAQDLVRHLNNVLAFQGKFSGQRSPANFWRDWRDRKGNGRQKRCLKAILPKGNKSLTLKFRLRLTNRNLKKLI